MAKTTVAVDQDLRKKIKRISALLNITQSAVIERAIDNLEKEIMSTEGKNHTQSRPPIENVLDISEILKEATQKIWERDPEREDIQKKLRKGTQTIDDFLINN